MIERSVVSTSLAVPPTRRKRLTGVGESFDKSEQQLQRQEPPKASQMRFYSECAMEWNRTYGGSDLDTTNSGIQTTDGGFALAGRTTFSGEGGDLWLGKINACAVIQWTQTYGGPDLDEATSVIQTADGGFALAGCTGFLRDGSKGRIGW